MRVNKLTPNFSVADIRETVQFYRDILGFSLVMAVPVTQDGIEQTLSQHKDYVYALLAKDDVELMFQQQDSFKEDVVLSRQQAIGASVSFYMEVEGLEEFHKQVKHKGVTATAIKTAWYGMREFYLTDNNGYILGFAQKSA